MSRIPLGHLHCVGLLVATAWFLGPALVAQEVDSRPSGTVAGDRVQLVLEREVFSYPSFERRNPFRALTGDDLGPRFEDMVLMGVVLSPRPENSIAVLGARPPGSANDQAATRLFRVRSGETVGNVRVIEIRQREVVFAVEDFGIVETRMLSMPTTGPVPGEASPQDAPEDPMESPGGGPADGEVEIGADTVARLLPLDTRGATVRMTHSPVFNGQVVSRSLPETGDATQEPVFIIATTIDEWGNEAADTVRVDLVPDTIPPPAPAPPPPPEIGSLWRLTPGGGGGLVEPLASDTEYPWVRISSGDRESGGLDWDLAENGMLGSRCPRDGPPVGAVPQSRTRREPGFFVLDRERA